MATMQDNAQTLVNVARQFRCIVELAEQINEMSALDTQLKELREQTAAVKKELNDVYAALENEKKDLETAKKEAAKIRADANQQARDKLKEANEKAGAIIGGADKRGAELIARAEGIANEHQLKADIAFKATEAKMQELSTAETRLQKTQEALRKIAEGIK